MKSNNSPKEPQRLKNNFSPYKNRENKTSFGKNSVGESLGGGEKKDTHTKLKKKTKLRIHMKKNIISFNKCKLDTM